MVGDHFRRSFCDKVRIFQLTVEPLGFLVGFCDLFHETVERFVEVHVTLDGYAHCDAACDEAEYIRHRPLGDMSERDLASSEMYKFLFECTQSYNRGRVFMCDKEAYLFSRRIVQQDAGCAHEADALLKKMKSFFCRRVMPVCLSDWIWLSHNGLTSVRQGLPYFFGNKGHERMKKSQKHLERFLEHPSSCRTLRMHCVLENRFDQFKVPIAVLMPEKVVESISRSVKPVGF